MKDPLSRSMKLNCEDTIRWAQSEMRVLPEKEKESETHAQNMLELSESLRLIEKAREAGCNGSTIEKLDSFLDSIIEDECKNLRK